VKKKCDSDSTEQSDVGTIEDSVSGNTATDLIVVDELHKTSKYITTSNCDRKHHAMTIVNYFYFILSFIKLHKHLL